MWSCSSFERAEITEEEEEATLWDMELLGSYSAESLLHIVYYFNGKLFGLRAGKHRLHSAQAS